jgi:hypothetical protein
MFVISMLRADDEQSESDDEARGADPVVEVPATLLRAPICGQIGGGPELDAIIDGDRAAEGEEDGEDLKREGRLRQMAGEHAEMCKRKEQKQVQQRGCNHPERHDSAEEGSEGGAHRNVDVRGLPVQRGMTEGRDVQLAAAHQTEDDDCE